MSEDSKMLMSVAGLVVTGAVGIALIASCSAESARQAESAEPSSGSATAVSRSVGPTNRATPAFEAPSPSVAEVENMAAATVEPPFRIDPGENLTARGIETYQAREFDKAVAYFQADVDATPGRPWNEYMLGLSLWKAGRHDEAVEALRRSHELDPDFIRTLINLSRVENDRGEFAAALAAAEQAVELDGGNATALFAKARSLYNLGRRDEAIVSLEASLDVDADNPYALNLYGLTLIEAGSESSAIEPLARAAELEPGVAYIHNNLGMALERSGRTAEALVAYLAAADADPAHENATANATRLEPLVSEEQLALAQAEPAEEQPEVAAAVEESAEENSDSIPESGVEPTESLEPSENR
jgi:tetratricopeptide (TPR) repeat protein